MRWARAGKLRFLIAAHGLSTKSLFQHRHALQDRKCLYRATHEHNRGWFLDENSKNPEQKNQTSDLGEIWRSSNGWTQLILFVFRFVGHRWPREVPQHHLELLQVSQTPPVQRSRSLTSFVRVPGVHTEWYSSMTSQTATHFCRFKSGLTKSGTTRRAASCARWSATSVIYPNNERCRLRRPKRCAISYRRYFSKSKLQPKRTQTSRKPLRKSPKNLWWVGLARRLPRSADTFLSFRTAKATSTTSRQTASS